MTWKTYSVFGRWIDPDCEEEEVVVRARNPEEAYTKVVDKEREDGFVFDIEDIQEQTK